MGKIAAHAVLTIAVKRQKIISAPLIIWVDMLNVHPSPNQNYAIMMEAMLLLAIVIIKPKLTAILQPQLMISSLALFNIYQMLDSE